MLMPSIFGESLLDRFFDEPFGSFYNDRTEMMKTDIKDTDHGYELTMNVPGVKKEDVKAELKDGYLTVNVSSNSSKDEKDENGRYIRRERYSGSCSMTDFPLFEYDEENIKAKFEDGTLKLTIPKKEAKPAVDEKKYIAIEG